ncbi:MAG: hypothetical protein RLZZ387_70 [Chloroflexota bacterium]|jgi:hypothetical protein
MSVIFIFVDGVGLAPAGPDNPLSDAATPALAALLGGPLTLEHTRPGIFQRRARPELRGGGIAGSAVSPATPRPSQHSVVEETFFLRAIDATLGVPGLPQSGTGHTALLAGVNASKLHGRHQPHFPPTALRPLLAEHSIFRRVAGHGGRPAFANAFGPGYWEALAARRIRRSASVIAAEGAGIRFRDGDDLRAGRATSWDITGAAMRARGLDTPLVTPQQAGTALAGLAAEHELVFFETFLPDLAGHGRLAAGQGTTTREHRPRANKTPNTEGRAPEIDDQGSRLPNTGSEQLDQSTATRWPSIVQPWSITEQIHDALERIDGLIAGVLEAMRPGDTLLLTSDHGNVESLGAPGHTRNPVPLLVVGRAASIFAHITDISEVADAVERAAVVH